MITYVFKMCCFIHKVLIGGRKRFKMFIISATARSTGDGEFAGIHSVKSCENRNFTYTIVAYFLYATVKLDPYDNLVFPVFRDYILIQN